MIKTVPLFAIPAYIIRVDPNLYDKQSIVDTINYNYELDNYRNEAKTFGNLHHSYNDWKNTKFKKIDYKKSGLIDVYNNIFNEWSNQLPTEKPFDYEYSFQNYTASKKTQYMRPHQHIPSCDFSAVHYIQFEKNKHNPTTFYNMNDFASYVRDIRPDFYELTNNKELLNSYLYEEYEMGSDEDDMIIFPSVLRHAIRVQEKECDKIRMTLVTNIKIQKQVV
tara:strand:- start:405 stop:1067 length:663 start_codon:yes stop_codon:yes gene_type:complete